MCFFKEFQFKESITEYGALAFNKYVNVNIRT